MQSRIIISSNLETRIEKIQKILFEHELKNPHPDLLYFESNEKLGIVEARKIKNHFSLKPYSAKGRAVILEDGGKLTVDGQNALLKILEEPPENALLLLGAINENNLLPTILSRCEIVYLEGGRWKVEGGEKFDEEIETLIQSSIEQKFEYIEKLEEKGEFLKSLIIYFRKRMHKNPNEVNFMKKLLEAEKWSRHNVNTRAILEYLLLTMDTVL